MNTPLVEPPSDVLAPSLTEPPPPFRNLRLEEDAHGVFILTFDRPGGGPNIFDAEVLHELDRALRLMEGHAEASALLLTSAKESIFFAGADLKNLRHATHSELEEMVHLGQSVFSRLESLPLPTIAVIHGACLGGGLELALACRYRVASDERATQLGLPETKLGLIPAWGGSTRLPRLLGLQAALKLILGGKSLKPAAALKLGLVDAVVPRDHLMETARHFLSSPPPAHPRHLLAKLPPVAALIKWQSGRQLLRMTRGNYPALESALKVVVASLHGDAEASFAREREAFLHLVKGSESRHLIGLFFAREKARKSETPAAKSLDNIAVIGAGVMGAGVAQWLSSKGKHIEMQDVDHNRVAKGMETVAHLYESAVKRKALTKHEAETGQDLVIPVAGRPPLLHMHLVIEAATENLALKRELFHDLESRVAEDTILATNTSALSVAEIAWGLAHPERVVGLHFFNPVHRMELVEVVRHSGASPEVVANVVAFAQSIGKLPVVVADRPGFVVNRILLPYLVEAGELHAQGIPTHLIDESMLNAGMPMGPLRLLDEIGLDVALHVARTLADAFPDRIHVPALLEKLVADGKLGKKSGEGFYRYDSRGHAHALRHDPVTAPPVFPFADRPSHHLLLMMINEAARCAEEKVAATPGDIDFAMVMGTGFAPFTGGPLHLADEWGAAAVVRGLHEIAQTSSTPQRYIPCQLLETMARDNTRFFP